MIADPDRMVLLSRMQEARRQIQRQLDMIDRQIMRRVSALIPQLRPKRTGYRRGKAPDPRAFLEHYRSNLAAIMAERQPEIDALARKLARQDAAIEAFRLRHGLTGNSAVKLRKNAVYPCNHAGSAGASHRYKECDHG